MTRKYHYCPGMTELVEFCLGETWIVSEETGAVYEAVDPDEAAATIQSLPVITHKRVANLLDALGPDGLTKHGIRWINS